jgi:hypothetical protein
MKVGEIWENNNFDHFSKEVNLILDVKILKINNDDSISYYYYNPKSSYNMTASRKNFLKIYHRKYDENS